MAFEFNKVGDGINASKCVEGEGFGNRSNCGLERPGTDCVNMHFIPRGCKGVSRRQKTVLSGGFLGDLACSAGRCNSIDGGCEFWMAT